MLACKVSQCFVFVLVFIALGAWSPGHVFAECKTAAKHGREPVRRAVIIGNGAYPGDEPLYEDEDGDKYKKWGKLKGPAEDIKLFAELLKQPSFRFDKVTTHADLTKAQMVALFEKLEEEVACDDDLLIVYSGHGAMLGDNTYFVPTDARVFTDKETKNKKHMLDVQVYLGRLKARSRDDAREGGRMLFFDACRNEIATKSHPLSKGIKMPAHLPFAAIYASGAGKVAGDCDEENCKGSVFTRAFIQELRKDCLLDPGLLVTRTRRAIERGAGQRPTYTNDGNMRVNFCTPFSDVVHVPAGTFKMGSSSGDEDEKPVHEVYVSGFFIDKYEVTVDEYKRCVEAGGCSTPKKTTADSREYNYDEPRRGKHPVNGVTWYQARAYCSWAGKRLPTEAEWEKAARGTDGRKYPWGNDKPSCDLAVMDTSSNDSADGCGQKRTWEVGSKPEGASPYGAHDMAGNVWEWTADWYGKSYYGSSQTRDPKGPTQGLAYAKRGGGWRTSSISLRTAVRNDGAPRGTDSQVGFRCAK